VNDDKALTNTCCKLYDLYNTAALNTPEHETVTGEIVLERWT